MSRILKIAAALLGSAAAAEVAGSAYLYRRTMIRYNAKTERTMKMSGVEITSHDGLKLHGTYFKGDEGNKAVICFHGYTSEGLNDYGSLSNYYLKHGFRMLLVDLRAHGRSEGEHIGFGNMDRLDGKRWVEWMIEKIGDDAQIWMIEKIGDDAQIVLHGNSMGSATVCMMSGLDLPTQVKGIIGIISDCAFTSMKDVFTHVLHSMYHIPAFPMLQLADWANKRKVGYGLDDCDSSREVKRAKVPFLFIHGKEDVFVPCWMTEKIYENCAAPKTKFIVEGAGHGEKDMRKPWIHF